MNATPDATAGWVPAAQVAVQRHDANAADFLPEGWTARCPDLAAVADGPATCAQRARLILDWAAAGLEMIDAADRTDPEPATMAGCWRGAVIEVHRWATHCVDAVTTRAAREARTWELHLGQMPRSETGLDPDGMRRVLACVCDHDECDDVIPFIEIEWPAANAALELTASDIGYISPAQAYSDYLTSIGASELVRNTPDTTGHIKQAAYARLGLPADWRRHKPINTADMVFDDDGTLLAVRPRPPSSRSRRPSHDTLVALLGSLPDGATTDQIAGHFEISKQSTRRSIDDLNPEFLYRGDTQRCVAQRRGRGPTLWRVTSDRALIDRCFSAHGQPGREYDAVYRTVSNGRQVLILDHALIRRW